MADAIPLRPRTFLGIERSFCGRPWRDRMDAQGAMQAVAIAQRHGLPELLARVLAGRGIQAEAVEAHLDPSIRRWLPDPSSVTDLEFAATRLASAVTEQRRVAIFGDYDVDGATASVLVASWLKTLGVDAKIHIPDRIFEGYGPNPDAVRALRAEGADLLITVDCGTTSHEALAVARDVGFETLVVDHHQAGETLPEAAAIVNPNRLDDLSGLGHVAACGVAFLLLVAANRVLRTIGWFRTDRPEPDLLAALDLVALGTVADVVPLKGLNRAFVTRGLAVMRRRARPGLTALMDVARLEGPPEPYHLGFLIGPRINAGGRIGDAGLGARLLLTEDEIEARGIAAELDRLNRERQTIEAGMLQDALEEAERSLGIEARGTTIVTASASWHPGVVGLVAARLKERYGRPAFAIALNEQGLGTGSGRSIAGADLGRVVRAAVEAGILAKGGGHAMAAGITLEAAKLGAFRAYLEERLGDQVAAARAASGLDIDGALSAGGATAELIETLQRAGPFGQGNPEPVFALPSHTLAFAEPAGDAHLRLRFKAADGAALDGIAFRCLGQPLGDALIAARGRAVHVAGTLSIDRWGGRERVKLRVVDAAAAA